MRPYALVNLTQLGKEMSHTMKRWVGDSLFFFLCIIALLPFIAGTPLASAQKASASKGTVSVFYAGSLVHLMERDVGPAFSRATGYTYQGEGRGSVALANIIKDKLRAPDVFISADPRVNDLLTGPENANLVRWYAGIFRNEMVVAYNPKSRFAAELEDAKTGKLPVYEVLQRKGFRLGRTDPKLDPKGYRTLFLFDLAERYYREANLAQKILGGPDNPTQIFPEEQLLVRLETGQLDAGIFYRNEAAERRLPYVTFPRELNLSDPALDPQYATATYVDPRGRTYRGSAIVYTVTILETSPNREGAIAFVSFLLSPQGREILQEHGLPLIRPILYGDKNAVPPGLQGALERIDTR